MRFVSNLLNNQGKLPHANFTRKMSLIIEHHSWALFVMQVPVAQTSIKLLYHCKYYHRPIVFIA